MFNMESNSLNNKITLLTLVQQNKEILFGKFSNTLTHEDKANKWKKITEQSISMGIISKERYWKYVRDTTWQNWRKRAMEKRDNRRKTGAPGGKKFKYDDGDKLIFDILGKEAPTLDGLEIPEPSGKDSDEIHEISKEVSINENIVNDKDNSNLEREIPKPNEKKSIKQNKNLQKSMPLKQQLIIKEIKLADEKIQIAQRQRFKLDLELYKLEKELNLPHSEFTRNLYESTTSLYEIIEFSNNEFQ